MKIKVVRKSKKIIITGLICITALELFALYNGVNGLILTGVVGVIAGAIGVGIPTPKNWVKL